MKFEELSKNLIEEKQHYIDFTDFFGRKVNASHNIEELRPLQPFYITKMIPKVIKVNVKLPLGEILPVEVDVAEYGLKIMELIEKEKNIPVDQQKLFLGERLVRKDFTKLMDQGICVPEIELTLKLKNVVKVQTFRGTIEAYIDEPSFTTISFVKDVVMKKIEVPIVQQILYYNNQEVFNHDTMELIGLPDGGTLGLELKTYVTFTGFEKPFKDFFHPKMTIKEIRKELNKTLWESFGITIQDELYDLECNNNLLEDSKVLREYAFGSEAEFKIKIKPEILCVKLANAMRKIEVYIHKSKAVEDVKKFLIDTTRLPAESVKILNGEAEAEPTTLLETLIGQQGFVELSYEALTILKLTVITLTGKAIEVVFDSVLPVIKLKTEIQKKEGIPEDQQRLIYAGKQMDDEKKLMDYSVPNEATIHLVLRLRGGGGGPGMPFADITQGNRAIDLQWADDAPEWRIVTLPGLSVEGLCRNRECVAFMKWVIINKGTGTYDAVFDQHHNKCPMCNTYVQTTKCGFNNCKYGYSGIMMQGSGEPPKKVTSQEEVRVGDNYKLFDPKVTGQKNWLSLKIVTRGLSYEDLEAVYYDELINQAFQGLNIEDESKCGICKKVIEGEKRVLECAHYYHPECIEKISELGIKCAYCHF